jgi:antirestriction protein ArdC
MKGLTVIIRHSEQGTSVTDAARFRGYNENKEARDEGDDAAQVPDADLAIGQS